MSEVGAPKIVDRSACLYEESARYHEFMGSVRMDAPPPNGPA
jgi:hypothetical protein